MTYSWDAIKSQVRQFRSSLYSIYPIQVWTMTKDFTIHNGVLYFLSNNSDPNTIVPSAQLQLYKIHLDQRTLHLSFSFSSWAHYVFLLAFLKQSHTSLERDYLHSLWATCPVLKKKVAIPGLHLYGDNSLNSSSLTCFDIVHNTMLFTWRDKHYVIPDITQKMIPKLIPYTTPLKNRSNLKLGGHDSQLIAFVKDRDIWITDFDGHETQLTFCCLNTDDPTLCSGIAEYMMQEEFHRLTGYAWCPAGKVECIAYLETSELEVEEIMITKSIHPLPTHPSELVSGQEAMSCLTQTMIESETVRYPRPGQANAKSEIKLVEFSWIDGEIKRWHKQWWGKDRLQARFPWMEYIVRFGWLGDGQSLWLQLLSRDQKQTAVIRLFVSHASVQPTDMETTDAIEILWEETSDCWINISDVFYFFQPTSDALELIWSSEKDNGFRHLYLVRKRTGQPSEIRALTTGEWCCVDRPLYVDEARSLVYFSAKLHTPLETHFYVIDLVHPSTPSLLTQLGFSHQVTMDSPDCFIDTFSSLHSPPVTLVQKINQEVALLMPVPSSFNLQAERPPSPPPVVQDAFDYENGFLLHEKPIQGQMSIMTDTVEPKGDIFEFDTSDGVRLYGCLYKPDSYEPGQSYPTLLYIYGGPKTQLVMNEFRFPRLIRYLMSVYFNFCVVVIDSRGSSDRGLRFESDLQYRLGQVELRDQLEGLEFLERTRFGARQQGQDPLSPVIDMNRLAITGWSYGGYLSLMALAQYPDRFKLAIAGAPVTQWELYDAAYTERYMGLPQDHPMAYQQSNVVHYVHQFPDNEHRLLIVHGLIDENVHFRNTEQLVTELIKHNKPHYLQVYPTEKHGLRHASVNEHFETLMFYWLKNYL
ncbi:Alpha/Beta hydrolase protein [Blakeslea trispora]|nr:Alpha/Beta hydrolase protein [Blakeslea trispora]